MGRWVKVASTEDPSTVFLEFYPSRLLVVSEAIKNSFRDSSTFEVLRKIGDGNQYDRDEILKLENQEVELFELELRELLTLANSALPYQERQKFAAYLQTEGWEVPPPEWHPDPEYLEKAVADGLRLCEASRSIRSPIQFEW
jgi:hypothetical protein